jgi:hypothetical protein
MYGHAMNVFETSDRGMVYIEPQFGWEVPEPKVGTNYWDILIKIGDSKGYNIKPIVGYVSHIRYIW